MSHSSTMDTRGRSLNFSTLPKEGTFQILAQGYFLISIRVWLPTTNWREISPICSFSCYLWWADHKMLTNILIMLALELLILLRLISNHRLYLMWTLNLSIWNYLVKINVLWRNVFFLLWNIWSKFQILI